MLFILQATMSQKLISSVSPRGRVVHLGTTQASLVPNSLAMGGGEC